MSAINQFDQKMFRGRRLKMSVSVPPPKHTVTSTHSSTAAITTNINIEDSNKKSHTVFVRGLNGRALTGNAAYHVHAHFQKV